MIIPFMRERKKLREQRTNDFFLDIYEIVTKGNENSIEELDKLHNETLFNPWYRASYRSATNYLRSAATLLPLHI